jgi:hypothetical protein
MAVYPASSMARKRPGISPRAPGRQPSFIKAAQQLAVLVRGHFIVPDTGQGQLAAFEQAQQKRHGLLGLGDGGCLRKEIRADVKPRLEGPSNIGFKVIVGVERPFGAVAPEAGPYHGKINAGGLYRLPIYIKLMPGHVYAAVFSVAYFFPLGV